MCILQWVPEITRHCPKTPFLLVGLEIDLRDDPVIMERLSKVKQKPVTVDKAKQLAHELKAVKYVECSIFTRKGLNDVFHEATLVAIQRSDSGKKGWFRMPKVSFPSLFKGKLCCWRFTIEAPIIIMYVCMCLPNCS